jgi:hypothetical protein
MALPSPREEPVTRITFGSCPDIPIACVEAAVVGAMLLNAAALERRAKRETIEKSFMVGVVVFFQ